MSKNHNLLVVLDRKKRPLTDIAIAVAYRSLIVSLALAIPVKSLFM
jgi:hypothetical protein